MTDPAAAAPQTPIPPQADKPEVRKQIKESLSLADSYENYAVETVIQFDQGAQHLRDIKAAQKRLEAQRLEITRPMDAAKTAVMDLFRGPSERLANAERAVKAGLLAWSDEQDRLAEEAARQERERAEREAEKLRQQAQDADEAAAAKHREKLMALNEKASEDSETEWQRLREIEEQIASFETAQREVVATRRAEAGDNQLVLQNIAGDEQRLNRQMESEYRRLNELKEAQMARDGKAKEEIHQATIDAEADQRERTARAETLEARADDVVAAPVVSKAPKTAGISKSKVWDFEIVDPSKVPDEYKVIDEKRIRAVVKALKADAKIPGVRTFQKSQMSARAS